MGSTTVDMVHIKRCWSKVCLCDISIHRSILIPWYSMPCKRPAPCTMNLNISFTPPFS